MVTVLIAIILLFCVFEFFTTRQYQGVIIIALLLFLAICISMKWVTL